MATAPVPATATRPAAAPQVVEHVSPFKPAWQKYGTPLIVVLLAVAVVVTITRNWNAWEGGRVDQVTNDAYVRGDLTPLSTKVPGLAREVKSTITNRSARATSWCNSTMTITRPSWRRLLPESKLRKPPSKTTGGSASFRIQRLNVRLLASTKPTLRS